MKQLLIGIAIVAVLGTAGFIYRYKLENPQTGAGSAMVTATSTVGAACAADAKICPDGTAVGRTGPNCSFAVCAPPNAELTTGSTTLSFVLPSGYQSKSASGSSELAAYTQSVSDASSSEIDVHTYAVSAGQTAGEVMLSNTVFDPSGLQATSTNSFINVTEGSNVFSEVLISDTEEQVQSAYYLTEPDKVIRFDVIERGVANWNDPSLDANTLPQHQALEQMLATLQIGSAT